MPSSYPTVLTAQLGPLSCHVLQAEADAPVTRGFVLCHGYGAPGDDLVPLGEELCRRHPEATKGVRFFFPEAPLTLEALGLPQGRAWWHIDLESRMRLLAQGPKAEASLYEEPPEGLSKARRALMGFFEEAMRHSGLDAGRMLLGGFSQGAMLTTDLCLSLEEAPLGLCVLSGSLVAAKEWRVKAPRRKGLKVFQSHGTMDPILGFAGGEALRTLLTDAGLQVSFVSFNGGHTIPAQSLEGMAELLKP